MTVIVADFSDEGAPGAAPGPEHFPRPDWDRAPWSRWAFLNMRQIFPSASVRRGGDEPTPMPRAPMEIDRVRFPTIDGGTASVGEALAATATNGFILIHRGRIVAERYFGGMSADATHLGHGLSAAITAATAGALIGAGRLDPDARVDEYLPELASTAWRGARLRHVMDMTTGVRFTEERDDPSTDGARLSVACGWASPPANTGRRSWPTSLLEQMLRLGVREDDHGARHAYRSIEADVLGLVIARVEGLPLADAISRRIWGPMGAEADGAVALDSMGVAVAHGGLSATLRDYARFAMAILGEGEIAGRRVLPAAWVDRIRRGAHGDADDALRAQFPNGCFRDMFWVEDRSGETLASQGRFGQLIYIAPESDLAAVKLSSWPYPADPARSDITFRALRAIAAELN